MLFTSSLLGTDVFPRTLLPVTRHSN